MKKSLTAKMCLVTMLWMAVACLTTYGLIAWAVPVTYSTSRNEALSAAAEALAEELDGEPLENCAAALYRFAGQQGAEASIVGPTGEIRLSTTAEGSGSAGTVVTADPGGEAVVEAEPDENIMQAVSVPLRLRDGDGYYILAVGSVQTVNQVSEAVGRVWPYILAAVLLAGSCSSAFYALFITRPVVRLTAVSRKLASLQFDWRAEEGRQDELGVLAGNLNELAGRLSDSMEALRAANRRLQADIEREKAQERQRTEFFSAASHELKTPLTVIKGQLSGMLDGVGVYADREKYLGRSLQVVGQMERLVQELLTVSKLETAEALPAQAADLLAVVRASLERYGELFAQREIRLQTELADSCMVPGDPGLLGKAVGNLLSNAAFHPPAGAEVRVRLCRTGDEAVFSVENTGPRIPADALPHLFEPFYRADRSRSRRTGGSGMGLYLAGTIARRFGGSCRVENTADGVRAELRLPARRER